jgi:hypothetical protein
VEKETRMDALQKLAVHLLKGLDWFRSQVVRAGKEQDQRREARGQKKIDRDDYLLTGPDWYRTRLVLATKEPDQRPDAERQRKPEREEVIDGEAAVLFELSAAGDPEASYELADFEHRYAAEHPCPCGGSFTMVSHDSAIPSGSSTMVCSCDR